MRQALFIYNPKAGQFKLQRERSIKQFCKAMAEYGIAVEVRQTAAPHDATRLARLAAEEKFTDVIVAGGDGTVNEAVQGLVGTNVRLTAWARGTANVLSRELAMPTNPKELARVVAKGKSFKMHLGCAEKKETNEKRYFFLMAGIGLDASIVSQVKPRLKKQVGKAAFVYSGLTHLAAWQPESFQIEIEGETYDATFAAIGKAPHYGGNLSITPRAQLDLPEFEICVINSTNRLRYLQLLSYAIYNGAADNQDDIRFFKTTRATAIGESLVQADGEIIGHLPMSFSIAPYTIEITTNRIC
jgi:YegS/Rv2252/BmrU family lipid kinase